MENVTIYKAHVGNVSHGLVLRVMQLVYIIEAIFTKGGFG